MMGILRTILFAATGLAATGAAFAQQTDSASLFRTQREHASPVAALAATAYATPALRSEAFAGSLLLLYYMEQTHLNALTRGVCVLHKDSSHLRGSLLMKS